MNSDSLVYLDEVKNLLASSNVDLKNSTKYPTKNTFRNSNIIDITNITKIKTDAELSVCLDKFFMPYPSFFMEIKDKGTYISGIYAREINDNLINLTYYLRCKIGVLPIESINVIIDYENSDFRIKRSWDIYDFMNEVKRLNPDLEIMESVITNCVNYDPSYNYISKSNIQTVIGAVNFVNEQVNKPTIKVERTKEKVYSTKNKVNNENISQTKSKKRNVYVYTDENVKFRIISDTNIKKSIKQRTKDVQYRKAQWFCRNHTRVLKDGRVVTVKGSVRKRHKPLSNTSYDNIIVKQHTRNTNTSV